MFCHWESLWCHFIWHMEHATRANCVKIPKFYKESRVSSARHPWEHCAGTKRAHKPFLKGPILASLLSQLMWHTQAIDHKSKDSLIKLDVHSPGRITVTHSPVKRQHLGPIQATCHMEHCSILIQMWLSYKAENLEKIASQCHHLRPFPWSRWTQSLMC